MQIKYLYKVYDLDGTFSHTINEKVIQDEPRFTSQINGGQGNLRIRLAVAFGSQEYVQGQVVKVYEINRHSPNGCLIYTGYIQEIERVADSGEVYIELSCIGLASLLTFVLYNSGGYTPSVTDDPAEIVRDLIDYFNTQYTGGWITHGTDVVNLGSNVNYDFDYTSIFDGVKAMQELSEDYYWHIKKD